MIRTGELSSRLSRIMVPLTLDTNKLPVKAHYVSFTKSWVRVVLMVNSLYQEVEILALVFKILDLYERTN